jgi:hypothetical protein
VKKLIQVLIVCGIFVFMGGSASGEEISLHCPHQKQGTRNYTIDKNGKYLITHEGLKENRNDGSLLNIPEKDRKKLESMGWWTFGTQRTKDSGYSCAEFFNFNTLSLSAFCFKKGADWDKLAETNERFCIPYTNPFK